MPIDPIAGSLPGGTSLRLFGYEFPLWGGGSVNYRQGTAFWEILEDHDIPATIYKIPAHFPPTETGQQTMSGMGTPDIYKQGGYGTYFLYTEDPFALPGPAEKKGEIVTVTMYDDHFRDYIYGPENPIVAVDDGEDRPILKVPLNVYIDPDKPLAYMTIGDDADSGETIILEVGKWSDFVEVEFSVSPVLPGVSGITRFLLQEVRPNFRLFMQPTNIDPRNPASDITTPSGWASELADKHGLFETKGMPEDTAALKDGVLTYDEFRAGSMLIYDKRKEMLFDFIEDLDAGVLFYYFCSIDLDCHMFWRLMDENHPSHDPDASDFNKQFIRWLYQDIDAVVGEVRKKLRPGDTLMVMSDHGFAPFYRTFNLNTWLYDNGYLNFKEDVAREDLEKQNLMTVDWANTQAYSIGFASIYLNKEDAERNPGGIVRPEEVDGLVDEICSKLMKERDPDTGAPIFLKMYKSRETYTGAELGRAPDIVAGFLSGYGTSDESAVGEFSGVIVQDNMSPWSGNHLMAAEEVPGIFFSNKKIMAEYPRLYDLTVTILNEFGIDKTPEMLGKSVYSAGGE
jgi:predicted AlkP superfamily phosphohydrolase/phosphomutase